MQQFRFIDPVKPALHVLGANYTHPQERLTVFRAFGINSSLQCNIPNALTTVKHRSSSQALLRMGVISARNM
jgi:hypothetical protein